MQPLMDLQPACSRIPLVAPGMSAYKWFLTGMRQFMSLQMALSDELLAALVTHEGPFTSVSAHMRLQVAGLREFLETLLERAYQHLAFLFWSLHFLDLGYTHNGVNNARRKR